MKQIVDKLNKIAKAIDENVELSDRDLIIDSLDSITKAFGGTPNDSNLIVDKLEDIAGVAEPKPTGNIELTENAENVDIAQYATATVNVSGGGGGSDLFETVQLKINLPDGYGYNLDAPAFFAIEDNNIITKIGERSEAGIYNIVIPTNGSTAIVITPMWAGGEVVIVDGDITEIENSAYLLSGNAEVTVQHNEG